MIDHDQETNGRFFRLRLGPRNQQKITHPWTTTIRHQYFAHLVARRGCNNGGRLRRFNIRASLVKALPLLEEQHCVEWIDRGVCWQGTLNNLPLGSPCENAISQVVKFTHQSSTTIRECLITIDNVKLFYDDAHRNSSSAAIVAVAVKQC